MSPKKAVVTGGAGFIGSNLVEALVAHGFETHIVDRDYAFRDKTLPAAAIRHDLDIRKTDELAAAIEGAEAVFHLAAVPRVQYSVENPVETTDENVTGTVSVLAAAAKAKVRRVVFSSSGAAYGVQPSLPFREDMTPNPVHPYGLQKHIGELFCKLWPSIYGIETVCLRYSNVYGPGMDPNGAYALAVGKFLDARKSGKPITIFGDGTVTRDFIHVSDVVRANILAAEHPGVGKGEIINISTGRNLPIKYIADLFGGEITYGPPRIEEHDSVADNSKAKALLGWEPTVMLEDGITMLKKEAGLA